GSMTSVYVTPIAKILGIRFVNGMIRNAPAKLIPFSNYWIRSKLTFPYSDIILANSYAGLKSYKAKSKKSVCIYNGFDFSRLKNLTDKETLKKKNAIETDNIVGMIGRFSESKDYETFISAANMVLQKRKDVTFLAIGEGVNCKKCKKLADTRFRDKIKFLDKQNDVESIINLFDIGVLATYTEGISNAVMEYMALGKPVVATRCGGIMELVSEFKTGLLVQTGDVINMSKRILYLLENKELAVNMGDAGKERIYNVFSLERMTNSYIDLYSDLLN
ncbi:glycosyltransferase, partial [Desulfococcaceae bacterium HSG8]|nr:glycosyltransferase [Desulfococcaceae bacterium HSG8]